MPVPMSNHEAPYADVPEAVMAVVKAVGELTQWNREHNGVRGKDVAMEGGVSKWTASRHIAKALGAGLLVNKEAQKGAPQKLALGAQLQPHATLQPLVAAPRLQEVCNHDATANCQDNQTVARLQPQCNPGPVQVLPLPEMVKAYEPEVLPFLSNPATHGEGPKCADCGLHLHTEPNPRQGYGQCSLHKKWLFALVAACEGFKQR
jgi:hypothetical protein